MKARTIRETEYTWEQIEEILAAGKARETFGEDGQITVQVEGIGQGCGSRHANNDIAVCMSSVR